MVVTHNIKPREKPTVMIDMVGVNSEGKRQFWSTIDGKSYCFTQIRENLFECYSFTDKTSSVVRYRVAIANDGQSVECSCPDHQYRKAYCKHRRAVDDYQEQSDELWLDNSKIMPF